MARIKANKDRWHRLTVLTDKGDGELLLVSGGRRPYLWAGRTNGISGCVTVSGAQTLRRLAKAILREVPPRR